MVHGRTLAPPLRPLPARAPAPAAGASAFPARSARGMPVSPPLPRGEPLDIIVTARNCDVPARLKDDARAKVERALRVFDRVIGVEMVFGEEANPRIPEPASVEVTARTKGHHIRAVGVGADFPRAVDAAMERFETQLRRYKTRLIDRGRRARPAVAGNGSAAPVGEPTAAHVASPDELDARIVRRKEFAVHAMLPEDAALQLELLGHDFYLFTHETSGRCAVVYRRRDGDLGLIEAVT